MIYIENEGALFRGSHAVVPPLSEEFEKECFPIM